MLNIYKQQMLDFLNSRNDRRYITVLAMLERSDVITAFYKKDDDFIIEMNYMGGYNECYFDLSCEDNIKFFCKLIEVKEVSLNSFNKNFYKSPSFIKFYKEVEPFENKEYGLFNKIKHEISLPENDEIRQLTLEDFDMAEQFAEENEQHGLPTYEITTFTEHIKKSGDARHKIYGYFRDNKMTAFMSLANANGNIWHIGYIYTSPEYRQNKIAVNLAKYFINEFINKDAFISYGTAQNENSEKTALSAGFELFSKTYNYYKFGGVKMGKKRVLISVSDKAGIEDLAKILVEHGYEIISTGGTEKVLKDGGVPTVNISDITGFPECLDGRVKTLHPNIHAGILAVRENAQHMGQLAELNVETIDIIVVNLYPFKETILKEPPVSREEAIENIDIGGPTMLRAAAKNWQDVTVIVDPRDYEIITEQIKNSGIIGKELKLKLAYKVFEHTAAYDTLIAEYLRKITNSDKFPENLSLTYEKVQEMRYGENPHQRGVFYKEIGSLDGTVASSVQLHGKELSYLNMNDANGALELLKEFAPDMPVVVAVKHATPCGVGTGANICEAYVNAYEADSVSIYGGIIALNQEVDEFTAIEMAKINLDIIIAPAYSQAAFDILTKKKNIRLLKLENISKPNIKDMYDMKKVPGGLLVQEYNADFINESNLKVVTKKQPSEKEMQELLFAFKIVKHTKSNGIALAKNNMSIGIGPGQTNRVTALEIALKYAGKRASGAVMASDAFLPFADCVELSHKAGITAIIQPGGSIRDQESIDACDKYNIAMVFTGMRHFKH